MFKFPWPSRKPAVASSTVPHVPVSAPTCWPLATSIPCGDAVEAPLRDSSVPVSYLTSFRAERDAIVNVLFYESISMVRPILVLHGNNRSLCEGGVKNFPMAPIGNRSRKAVVAHAVAQAKAWLQGARSSVSSADSPPRSVASVQPVAPPQEVSTTAVVASPHSEAESKVEVFEGVITSMGLRPYASHDGRVKNGRPSFAVTLDGSRPIYGSDLGRACNESDAFVGDSVRLCKSRVTATGGRRSFIKNHWEVVIVERGPAFQQTEQLESRQRALAAQA